MIRSHLRALFFITSVAGGVLVTIAACVGSDPATAGGGAAAAGEHLGPCYPNGTCNQGLECRDTVCLTPGEPAPDGGGNPPGTPPGTPPTVPPTTDGGTDSAPDGGGCIPLLVNHTGISCSAGDKCIGGASCCGDGGSSACIAPVSCAGSAIELDCLTNLDCAGSGNQCCTPLPAYDLNTCPPTITLKLAQCFAGSCPSATHVQLCDQASPACPATLHCNPVNADVPGGGKFLAGACVPP